MFWVLFAAIIRSTAARTTIGCVWFLMCYSIGAGTGFGHPYTQARSRANDERNKEYSVHLVGPELNIYDTKTHGTTNIKKLCCVVYKKGKKQGKS
jgi:hypothetical protein